VENIDYDRDDVRGEVHSIINRLLGSDPINYDYENIVDRRANTGRWMSSEKCRLRKTLLEFETLLHMS